LESFGGSEPPIRLGGIHKYEVTAGWDQLNGGFEAVGKFARAAIAEGAALKQHKAFPRGEGRCSCFFQRLNGMARFSAVEAAEVEAAPAGIYAALD
jgi:hypothetical protein